MKEDDQQPKQKPVSGISDSKLNLPAAKKKTVRINLPPTPPGSPTIHLTTGSPKPKRPWWKFWQR